jgi:CheY-like chemotaxis protein
MFQRSQWSWSAMTLSGARDRQVQSVDNISGEAANVDVLVIEGCDGSSGAVVKDLSRSSAISVVVQNSGVEALSWLTSRGIMPKVILLSFRLTDMEGLEVLRAIRANPRTSRRGAGAFHQLVQGMPGNTRTSKGFLTYTHRREE